jgi:hypothetical protein
MQKSAAQFVLRRHCGPGSRSREWLFSQAKAAGAVPIGDGPVRAAWTWEDWRFRVEPADGKNVAAVLDKAMAFLRLTPDVLFAFHEYTHENHSHLLLDQFAARNVPRASAKIEAERCEVIGEAGGTLLCRTTPRTGRNALKVADALSKSKVQARALAARHRPNHGPKRGKSDSARPPESEPWELSANGKISVRTQDLKPGSPEVTIAVIDDGFSVERGEGRPVLLKSAIDPLGPPLIATPTTHGQVLADLLLGREGQYPGVAPGCPVLEILLPTWCTEAEEIRAFELAVEGNAAIVCCAWGPPFAGSRVERPIPVLVARSIDELARRSRQGRGAIVFFAVGNDGADFKLDGYASYPTVTAVTGITQDGSVPKSLDRGSGIKFSAPMSSKGWPIGGTLRVPSGASGSVALAAGAAARVLSANPALSRPDLLAILSETSEKQWETAPLINAAAGAEAVSKAKITPPSTAPLNRVPAGTAADTRFRRYRARRYLGGEHTTLSDDAWGMLQARYGNISLSGRAQVPPRRIAEIAATTMFGPGLESVTAPGTAPRYSSYAGALVDSFLGPEAPIIRPSFLRDLFVGDDKLDVRYFLGLAADIYGDPTRLGDGIALESKAVQSFSDLFRAEIEEGRPTDRDIIAGSVRSHYASYLQLMLLNYSHFIGHNLLFYLAYHFLAVFRARIAGSAAALEDQPKAHREFSEALILEAFAGHFLSDMFSAGHARMPRHAYIYGMSGDFMAGQIVSRILHNHEGRHGVLFNNLFGHCWVGLGDGFLHQGSDLFRSVGGNLRVSAPTILGRDVLPQGNTPVGLAVSLIYASLIDVFRHLSTDITEVFSTTGPEGGENGILGYILRRVPYALPPDDPLVAPLIAAANRPELQGTYDIDSRYALGQILDLLQTYLQSFPILVSVLGEAKGVLPAPWEFPAFYAKYLTPEAIRAAVDTQLTHLTTAQFPNIGALDCIPTILEGTTVFAGTTVDRYRTPAGAVLYPSWRNAVPLELLQAYTKPKTWGFVR